MYNDIQALIKQRIFIIGNDKLNTNIKSPEDIILFFKEHHCISQCSFSDMDFQAQSLFLRQNELTQNIGGTPFDINTIQFYFVPNHPCNQAFYSDYQKHYLTDNSCVYLYWDLSRNHIWSNSGLLSVKCELLKGIKSVSIESQDSLYKNYSSLLDFYIKQIRVHLHEFN